MDVLEAKQSLSARYLPLGFRSKVVARVQTMSVDEAVAGARLNVHAVGIGHKFVNGQATTDDMVVRVHVVQKIAPSLLSPRDRIPETIDGIPTDIIESAPAFALARRPRTATGQAAPAAAVPTCSDSRKGKQRPLVAGISVAHRDITAGTLGYFCRSRRQGDNPQQVHILSNNHVLANVNKGYPGDDIYQPGPADGGDSQAYVADLVRFTPIDLSGAPNRVDGAIAKFAPDIQWRPEICTIGSIKGTAAATVGMSVCKHGRTTGYTEGIVTDIAYDALIGMNHSDASIVGLFQNQIRVESIFGALAFGLGGDSGSLVVELGKKRGVGLYFAGPPSGNYGVANQISDVLSELEIELVDGADIAAIT
ncbi:S1 family peptidase [Mesorhizobium onobrychidis]|uniref:Serine protease n=1 Tax=Mesorhizobium onobrychidis TaxID=2775404 RepID=A0ABY5QNZ8_9HYPH|nr:S1 family peptidase [Mesorhizobium onobrychidis]UVC12748.1 hypothetical protein IHQ72_18360 [Mesorhizobium onobrychidis]